MGYEAACTLHMDGGTSHGTVRLEGRELLFRGLVRLTIPLTEIRSAIAANGVLTIRFGGRVAHFEMGPAAASWAARITSPPSRLDKLGVRPGMRVVAAGVPDPGFLKEVEQRGAILVTATAARSAPVDLVFHPAEERAALERLAELRTSITPAGAIWVVRPKGSKAITESETMTAGKRAGLVDVKVVSFSDAYTAEKFVIPVADRPGAGRKGARVPAEAHGRAASHPARGVKRGPR